MRTYGPPRPNPWLLSGHTDPDARRLLAAIARHRDALIDRFAHVPVQEQPLRTGDESAGSLFPVGALVQLWDRWPSAFGNCPACRGSALAIGYGGLISDAYVHGACIACARLVHRHFHGISDLRRAMLPALSDSPFSEGGSWALNSSNGLPHTSLVHALSALGERDLPHPHAYGFVGGHPHLDTIPDGPERNRIRRASSWSSQAEVRHITTDARVDANTRSRALVETFVGNYLDVHERLPEGAVTGPDFLQFHFPFIRAESVDEPRSAAPAVVDRTNRYLVMQVMSTAAFEEIVWWQECWCAANAHAALEQRLADTRRDGCGDIFIFDRAERRLLRSVFPVRDGKAVVERWLDDPDVAPRSAPDVIPTVDALPRPRKSTKPTKARKARKTRKVQEEDPESGTPRALQADIDRVVAAMNRKRNAPAAFARVTAWFTEARSDAIQEGNESVPGIRLANIAGQLRSDYEDDTIRESLDLAVGERVTPDDRLRYVEEHVLPTWFDDADLSSCFAPVQIVASDGTSAVLVVDVKGYSFSGVSMTWDGPYPSFEAFVASLPGCGWVTSVEDFAAMASSAKRQWLRIG